MSQEKLNEIQKRIEQIQNIGEKKEVPTPIVKDKDYGAYQHFQSECLKKTEPDNPNSPSRIEIITGKVGVHSTERMAQCSYLWKKYRGLPNPIDGLKQELDVAEKVIKGELPEP